MNINTITINGLKLEEQEKPRFRGGPRCVLSTNAKGRAELRFNAVLLEEWPALQKVERVRVFVAAGAAPVLGLFPGEEGARLRDERGGARKMCGMSLRALAEKYRMIRYKVAAAEQPGIGKGWLLSPVESERR